MEPYGYSAIDCAPPDRDLVAEIWAFYNNVPKIAGAATIHVQGNERCERLLQSGVKEPVRN